MYRSLLGALATILLIVAIMLARAAMVDVPASDVPAAAPINIDGMNVARHLAEAVRFQTISYGGKANEAEKNAALEAMRSWLATTYPKFHKAATREIMGESLLYTWKGTNPALPPILLMAHMDVVPVVPGTEKDWEHQPFSGDIAGGYVWGRGSIDDKGSLIAILEAAERLAATGFTPERTVMIAVGQDEELGGDGAMAKTLAARGVHFAWALDEGGIIADEPFPGVLKQAAFVAVAEKGYLSLELVAHGEGGHSSRPSRDMAVTRLAEAVLKVVHHPFRSGLDDIEREKLHILAPAMPFVPRLLLANLWIAEPIVLRLLAAQSDADARLHTTIAPTMLSAGVKDNVLPPVARATINLRLNPRDTIDSAVEHVRGAIDDPKVDIDVLDETQTEASKPADINGASYKFLAKEIQASFGNIPVAPDMTSGATDSRYYQPMADSVLRFVPFRFGPDDLGREHGTNERLAVGNLAPAVAFYMRLMRDTK
ncbi:MAG TPA: M20 family peptidase [Rhizomicrobium sp.]|nr:M20 family peptidase [Rhizomicrobium sp.]